MKTVGIVGGTGWPGTRDYYTLLNKLVQQRLGAMHGLEQRVWSFDFQGLLDRTGADQVALEGAFADAVEGLRAAGAQLIALASNTGHLYLREVLPVGLPVVHIATACAQAMAASGVLQAGVLSTQRALMGGVFNTAFSEAGIHLTSPVASVAADVDKAIFMELEQGFAGPLTRNAITQALQGWTTAGIKEVLLGCTEIRPELLVDMPVAANFRLWDSTHLHCMAIVDAALDGLDRG